VPVYRIPEQHLFPHPELAEAGGLLGVGGDLDPDRLLLGYSMGIFPWYSEDQPILWFSPDPRFILHPRDLRVQRSLRKRIRRGDYQITMDRAFEQVISSCQKVPRPGQSGTWITQEMREAYIELHRRGFAHSVEAWEGEELVGGLYGVSIGSLFSGESMFARRPDASKIAFVWLVEQLRDWGFKLIDCQVFTQHLERFGALNVPRSRYLAQLPELVETGHHPGPWRFAEDFHPLDEFRTHPDLTEEWPKKDPHQPPESEGTEPS
jgi:leucyl/phenylalanyl-tRNA--protein transferase